MDLQEIRNFSADLRQDTKFEFEEEGLIEYLAPTDNLSVDDEFDPAKCWNASVAEDCNMVVGKNTMGYSHLTTAISDTEVMSFQFRLHSIDSDALSIGLAWLDFWQIGAYWKYERT